MFKYSLRWKYCFLLRCKYTLFRFSFLSAHIKSVNCHNAFDGQPYIITKRSSLALANMWVSTFEMQPPCLLTSGNTFHIWHCRVWSVCFMGGINHMSMTQVQRVNMFRTNLSTEHGTLTQSDSIGKIDSQMSEFKAACFAIHLVHKCTAVL